jgi:phage baseplate assembly protein gpV
MSERLKMILRVLAFIGATLFLAFLLYYFLLRRAPVITPTDDVADETLDDGTGANLIGSDEAGDRTTPTIPTTDTGLQPSAVADGGLTLTLQLTASSITTPTLSNGDEITFYDPSDGSFYSIDSNGNLIKLSVASFPLAETVVFSDDANKVALEFPDGSNIIYDLTTDKQTTLPSHWEDFGFAPGSEEVASKSITVDPYARSLVVTNTDGSQATAIIGLGNNADDVTINWSPNSSIVAFSETGSAQSAFGRQEIFLISPSGEAVGAIIVEGSNFSSIWSPSGENILYSIAATSNNDRPSLWLVDGSGTDIGSGRQELNVETWVEKCTFKDEVFVLCAVPRIVPNYSGFDHRIVTSGDDLYQINLTTGRISLLAELTVEMQMHNLSVSEDGGRLYFTDAFGRLNTLALR